MAVQCMEAWDRFNGHFRLTSLDMGGIVTPKYNHLSAMLDQKEFSRNWLGLGDMSRISMASFLSMDCFYEDK